MEYDDQSGSADDDSRRGRKLAPGLYWVGFRDPGYRRNALWGGIVLVVVTAIRILQ